MTSSKSEKFFCDVLVIGGGPAGSTISTLLAAKGWRVTLLEKEQHPRFHIGESLLPMNMPILERLGVLEDVKKIGVIKHAVEFSSDHFDGRLVAFRFENAFNNKYPYAFQVRRSEFDYLLLTNSKCNGVDVHQGVTVREVERLTSDMNRVHAVNTKDEAFKWKCRFVIDATGRDTLLSRKFGWKKKNTKHNSAAIFGHFENVIRRSGKDEGNLTVYWFDYGWLWMIPLRNGFTSVGAVCWPDYLKTRSCPLDEFLWRTIKLSTSAYERMRSAKLAGNAWATGNYSYQSKRLYKDRCLLVGDAAAFIDPVFSSGVYLAMYGGFLGAELVDQILLNEHTTKRLVRRYEQTIARGLRTYSWFIYRFTSPAMHRMFMHPTNRFRLEQAIITMFAGDVFAKAPIKWRLLLFKLFYYAFSLAGWRHTWSSYRTRRRGVGKTFSQENLLSAPNLYDG